MRETNPCAISSLRELEYEFAVINNMSSESKSPVCLINMNMGSYCERNSGKMAKIKGKKR